MDIKEAIEKHLRYIPTKGTHVAQLFTDDLIIYIKYTVDVIERKIPDSSFDGSDIYEAEITKITFNKIIRASKDSSPIELSDYETGLIKDIFNLTAMTLVGKKYDW